MYFCRGAKLLRFGLVSVFLLSSACGSKKGEEQKGFVVDPTMAKAFAIVANKDKVLSFLPANLRPTASFGKAPVDPAVVVDVLINNPEKAHQYYLQSQTILAGLDSSIMKNQFANLRAAALSLSAQGSPAPDPAGLPNNALGLVPSPGGVNLLPFDTVPITGVTPAPSASASPMPSGSSSPTPSASDSPAPAAPHCPLVCAYAAAFAVAAACAFAEYMVCDNPAKAETCSWARSEACAFALGYGFAVACAGG